MQRRILVSLFCTRWTGQHNLCDGSRWERQRLCRRAVQHCWRRDCDVCRINLPLLSRQVHEELAVFGSFLHGHANLCDYRLTRGNGQTLAQYRASVYFSGSV